MTNTPRPKNPVPPRSNSPVIESDSENNKPYKLVTFPTTPPPKAKPAGHHKYLSDRLHGTLFLSLQVQTPLHISTGVVAMGSDIGARPALIKTMTVGSNQKLVIQGSSLKGCIRSVFEAITNSTLAVSSRPAEKIPRERQPCKKKDELCPASQVFGALDWQGLVEFSDAKCESTNFGTGFMPSLYRPRPDQSKAYYDSKGMASGRKFYYNFAKSIDKGQNQGIPVQQASKDFTFITEIHFKNLKPAELGTLLIVLGQDPNYPIALKIGGGKPIGMGTMTIKITQIEQASNLKERYSKYISSESDRLTGNKLQEFMQKQIKVALSSLVQAPQLKQIADVLSYPTERQPPSGMY